MLFARLQTTAPTARSYLVTGARSEPDAGSTAGNLAEAIVATGHRVRWFSLAQPSDGESPPSGADELSLLETELGDVQRARSALESSTVYTVICGAGILDSPRTLLLSGAVDGVVVVVDQGRTLRSDLEQARDDVERGGGRLLGAVVLK